MRCTVHRRGNHAEYVPWCLPRRCKSRRSRVGREGDGSPESLHSCSTKRKRHRMSGLIGRLISHLAQKYIVEALGSTSALSEP